MLPPIFSVPLEHGAPPIRYKRLVSEWRRRYAKAKNRADSIRAKSQRRWNGVDVDADPLISSRAEHDVADLFSLPKRHTAAAESSAARVDRLLRKAVCRPEEGRRTAPQSSTSTSDRIRMMTTLEERLHRLAADAKAAANTVGSAPSRRLSEQSMSSTPSNSKPPSRKSVAVPGMAEHKRHRRLNNKDEKGTGKVYEPSVPRMEKQQTHYEVPEPQNVKDDPVSFHHNRRFPIKTLPNSLNSGSLPSLTEPHQSAQTPATDPVAAAAAKVRTKLTEGERIDPDKLSRIERFFYDEELRLRKKKERERRREMRSEKSQEDPITAAKKAWEMMQKDVNNQWKSYRPASSNKPNSGNTTQTPGGDPELARTPIRELKQQLRSMGVGNVEMHCMERHELLALLEKRSSQRHREEQIRIEREDNERLRTQIIGEVEEWRKNRSLRWLLNNVNRAVPGQAPYLPATATFEETSKSYKRALLKIHPDKHIGDLLESRYRAEETFKAVNESYNRFRSFHDIRSSIKS